MDQGEFSVVEDYLRMNQYPKGISKRDKANLRCKCKNFKFDCGVLYFRRVKKGEGDEEGWKIVLGPKTKEDAFWSHAMLELKIKQKVYIIQYDNCIPVFVHVGSHLGRDKTIQKISSRFFWKNINDEYLYNTATNVRELTSKSNAKLHPIVPMPNVWHQVGDFVCRYKII